jgi:hypothetical protein
MHFRRVLMNCGSRLSAAIAFVAVEIQRSDGMLAKSTFECDSAIHSIRSVVAHRLIVDLRRS